MIDQTEKLTSLFDFGKMGVAAANVIIERVDTSIL
jgi:hypothetical protein